MRQLVALVPVLVAALAACGGAAMTEIPAGYPLNPCPVAGPDAIVAREGYILVPPGTIVLAYELWHNETPQTFACGAQSIKGGSTTLRSSDFESGFVPWVATFRRAVPLAAPEGAKPTVRVFRVDGATPVLVETAEFQDGPQYGALGNIRADQPPGEYSIEIVSASGSILAEGIFEFVE
jgi:hypothetical protein